MSIASRIVETIIAMLCVAALATPPNAAEETAPPPAASRYGDLVAQLRNGRTDVDLLALRNAYAEDASYDPYAFKLKFLVPEMNKAFAERDCATAMTRAQSILDITFVYIDAHFVTGICRQQAGEEEPARRAITLARGLLGSILKSGDGKSPETAYQVIMIAEEYTVLGGLRLRKQSQSLINANGHVYDRLDAKPADSETPVAVFFNIDRPMAALGRQLQQKK